LPGKLCQVVVCLFIGDIQREFPEMQAQGRQLAGIALQGTQGMPGKPYFVIEILKLTSETTNNVACALNDRERFFLNFGSLFKIKRF
jgi:hypothetical protein